MSERSVIKGVCEFYSETGTEGGYWAVQNTDFIHGPTTQCPWEEKNCPVILGISTEHYSFHGLHRLKNGDMLTVYDSNRTHIIWSGEVSLIQARPFTQSVNGVWVHSLPQSVEVEQWAQWFFANAPADLLPL